MSERLQEEPARSGEIASSALTRPVVLPAARDREAIVAMQRGAGNHAVSRAILARAGPPDPPAGVTLGVDPLPQGANVADPDKARAVADPNLPGGWTGGREAQSRTVGGVDRILIENLPGNQSQQANLSDGSPGPGSGRGFADAAGPASQPRGQRGRAVALVPRALRQAATGGEVGIVLHFHGLGAGVRGAGDNPSDVDHYQMPQQLEAFLGGRAGASMIALMPVGISVGERGGRFTNTSFGGLDSDTFINACFRQLQGVLPSGSTPGDVAVSAHSGGGLELSRMLGAGGGRMPARMRAMFLFEAFHGDLGTFVTYITGRLDADLRALETARNVANATPDQVFAAQAQHLQQGMRVVALGGFGGYATRVREIRTAILRWWDRNAGRLAAAAAGRSQILDALWANYQAQFFPGSTHMNALATANNNLGRALATLPQTGAFAARPAATQAPPPPPPPPPPPAPTATQADAGAADGGAPDAAAAEGGVLARAVLARDKPDGGVPDAGSPAGATAEPDGGVSDGGADAGPSAQPAPLAPPPQGGGATDGAHGGGAVAPQAPQQDAQATQGAGGPTQQPAQQAGGGAAQQPAQGAGTAPPPFQRERYRMSGDEVTVVSADAESGRREIRARVSDYTAEILRLAGENPTTWYGNFTSGIRFLGQPVRDPIHIELATHLRTVEGPLARQYGGPSADPAVAGTTLGLNEEIIGSRQSPTSAAVSMHLFGLAIDVNYTANPFISASANAVFRNAGLLVTGAAAAWRANMTYDQLAELDRTLTTYFSYLDDQPALDARLAVATARPWRRTRGARARALIEQDLNRVGRLWQRSGAGQLQTIRRGGFTDLSRGLVDGIGLAWGAAYGDMMHFDMRNAGVGQRVHNAIERWKRQQQQAAMRPAP